MTTNNQEATPREQLLFIKENIDKMYSRELAFIYNFIKEMLED